MMNLRLLQLCDSAFPSGAFAHSGGLEALKASGHLGELKLRLTEFTWSTARAMLPFVSTDPGADARCDVFLTSHVANRASRAQGAAFALAVEAAFGTRVKLPFMHLAPVMGAALPLDDARTVFLFGSVRSAVSSAVRLGAVGPLKAQQLLHELLPVIERALAEPVGEPRACAPVLELCQQGHDALYSRLFQS
jgi:urease accessory protein